MSVTPINRYTERIVENDGTRAYKVYNKASPHYYKDKAGSYHSIDVTNVQTITKASVGEIKLREKNIVSAGLRTDGNKTKYLGLRPDNTQEDGTHQLEWTIEEAVINNSNQSITLNQTTAINNVTTNLGGQVVQSTRNYTRQMVPVSGTISNFQVKYKLHLTGLQISNSKYTQNTTIRNNISGSGTITTGTSHYTPDEHGRFIVTDSDNKTQFMIKLPILLDSNFDEVTSDTTHTLKDNGDGTYEYIKYPSDNLLSEGISDNVAYIDATSVYGDADLDGNVYFSSFFGWNAVHDNATGTAAGTGTTGLWSSSFVWDKITRLFLGFDTSDIESTPTSAVLKVYTTSSVTSDGIAIKATHTSIASSTFNDFVGWGSGWDGDDVTDYSSEVASFDANQYNDFTLNSTALDDIAGETTFKVCIMNHNYDYEDDDPINQSVSTYIYLTEQSDTDKDPYLYITEVSAPSEPALKIIGAPLKINGGQFIIK